MPRVNLNTAEYWDYIYSNHLFPPHDQNNKDRWAACATLQEGKSALDIGCGLGALRLYLGDDIDYTGVDYSPAGIETRVSGVGEYIVADYRDIQQKADTVYLLEIVEHQFDPAEIIAKAVSLAKKRVVISVPVYGAIDFPKHRGEHLWDFTIEEITSLMQKHGKVSQFIMCGVESHVAYIER